MLLHTHFVVVNFSILGILNIDTHKDTLVPLCSNSLDEQNQGKTQALQCDNMSPDTLVVR